MSTITVSDVPLSADSPAQHLRRTAAAVRVHFTWWGVRRTLTRQQKDEAAQSFGADGQFLSAGKKLVDTAHPKFRALTALKGQVVDFWKGNSLPFTEPGVRLIRQADIERFVHALREYREELHQAERELNAVSDDLKENARQRLGRLYDPTDYPSVIRGLFDVEYDFPSVEPPSYLLRLSPEVYQQEQQRVAARFEEAVRLAEEAFAAELADLVNRLAERLTPAPDGQRRVFRDTAITGFHEFFRKFRTLSVRSNPELDALMDRAERLISGLSPEDVRSLPGVRQELQTGMTGIAQQLDDLLVELPRRRIIRINPSSNGGTNATGD